MSHFISIHEKKSEENSKAGSLYEVMSPKLVKSKTNNDKEEILKQNPKFRSSFIKKEQDIRSIKQKQMIIHQYEKIKKKMGNGLYNYRKTTTEPSLHKKSNQKERLESTTAYFDNKYNNLINLRINALKEIENITQNKQKLIKWNNLNRNSTVKSPNFNKMNYLLQKIKQESISTELFQNPKNIAQNKLKIFNKYLQKNYISLSKLEKHKRN